MPAALLVPVAPAHAAGVIQMFDCAPGNTANGLASLGMTLSGACTFVQPGSVVNFPGFDCTLNYVFRGSNGSLYMGTAGHCTLGSPIGAMAVNNDSQPIGHLAFRVFNENPADPNSLAQNEDFALVRLLPTDTVDPQVFDLGGPTALYTGTSAHPVILRWVGQALDLPPVQGTPAPAGVATAVTRANAILFTGPGIFGDSGAPVEIAGQAACIFTGLASVDASYPPWYGSPTPGHEIGEQWCSRLDVMLRLAERALHLRLTFVTAPALPRPGVTTHV